MDKITRTLLRLQIFGPPRHLNLPVDAGDPVKEMDGSDPLPVNPTLIEYWEDDLYNFIESTARHITNQNPHPAQWPQIIAYLVACMENTTACTSTSNPALSQISRRIARRLYAGDWI
jgi:hypothetical protein